MPGLIKLALSHANSQKNLWETVEIIFNDREENKDSVQSGALSGTRW